MLILLVSSPLIFFFVLGGEIRLGNEKYYRSVPFETGCFDVCKGEEIELGCDTVNYLDVEYKVCDYKCVGEYFNNCERCFCNSCSVKFCL